MQKETRPEIHEIGKRINMLPEEKELGHWMDHFYGYGAWQSRFWLVAHEESGGDLPAEVAEKVNYFYQSHGTTREPTLCNIRDVYKHCAVPEEIPRSGEYPTLYDYRFGSQARVSTAWKNLVAFEHGYLGQSLPNELHYQQKFFADPARQQEALIKLYPLPAPHSHAWYYSWLDQPRYPFLKNRPLYQQHFYAPRVATLFRHLRQYKPEVVLMYGMEQVNALKKSATEFFPGIRFKAVKAIPQHLPSYHRAEVEGTLLLITTQIPLLRHHRVETGFDWHAFGQHLASQR
jgi:hypothetical protein